MEFYLTKIKGKNMILAKQTLTEMDLIWMSKLVVSVEWEVECQKEPVSKCLEIWAEEILILTKYLKCFSEEWVVWEEWEVVKETPNSLHLILEINLEWISKDSQEWAASVDLEIWDLEENKTALKKLLSNFHDYFLIIYFC